MRSTLLFLFLFVGCASVRQERASGAEELGRWMTGSFSSAAQAAERPDDYFEIRLVMVPIWTERADGPWLYVEQAAATALDRPYRQRVYHLVDEDGGVVRSDVYALPGDPLELAGAWERTEAFGAFGPEALVEREGCSIWLEPVGDGYAGSTLADSCGSTQRGASYATSEVTIVPDLLTSWDRGFDAAGNQEVWGAEAGPYAFERVAVHFGP